VISVVAAISPYRETRDEVKNTIARFVEFFVDCPISPYFARRQSTLLRGRWGTN
jgi:adenylylsulfate kinase-like enzyme